MAKEIFQYKALPKKINIIPQEERGKNLLSLYDDIDKSLSESNYFAINQDLFERLNLSGYFIFCKDNEIGLYRLKIDEDSTEIEISNDTISRSPRVLMFEKEDLSAEGINNILPIGINIYLNNKNSDKKNAIMYGEMSEGTLEVMAIEEMPSEDSYNKTRMLKLYTDNLTYDEFRKDLKYIKIGPTIYEKKPEIKNRENDLSNLPYERVDPNQKSQENSEPKIETNKIYKAL